MKYESLTVDLRPTNVNPGTLRSKGMIPGVLFGEKEESISVVIPENTLIRSLTRGHKIYLVKVNEDKEYLINIEKIQRHPVTRRAIHFSFHRIKMDEETKVVIPIHFEGRPTGEVQGGVFVHEVDEVEVIGLPADIPEKINVDVTTLEVGSNIHVKDIVLPTGTRFNDDDLKKIVCTCNIPKVKEEEPVAGTEMGAEGEGEGEGEEKAEAPTEAKKEEKAK